VKYHSRADRLVSEHLRKEKEVESSHIVPLLLKFHRICNLPLSTFNVTKIAQFNKGMGMI
jgi:hypothetical protein